MFLYWVVGLLAVAVGTRGDAEVMSHVTAHFGKTLEECREEVSVEKIICQKDPSLGLPTI